MYRSITKKRRYINYRSINPAGIKPVNRLSVSDALGYSIHCKKKKKKKKRDRENLLEEYFLVRNAKSRNFRKSEQMERGKVRGIVANVSHESRCRASLYGRDARPPLKRG